MGYEVRLNLTPETITEHITKAKQHKYFGHLIINDAHKGTAVIAAYGPTLKDTWQGLAKKKGPVFACNAAFDFLVERGIVPKFHVICDGHECTTEFVKNARDDVVFMATTGSGLGRHLALNTANGAAITPGGDLEASDSTAGFVGLRHRWNDRWRSSVDVSGFEADNDPLNTGSEVTRRVHSYSINLLCSPVPEMTVGVEYMHAERELESGAQGDLYRFQFSAKYAFKYSPTRR